MSVEPPAHPLLGDWQNLIQAFGVQPGAAQVAFSDLVAAYASPNRYYHTLEHIRQVLQTVQLLKDYAKNLEIVRLAVWFHDVVYDSQATDNEERSADYADKLLNDLEIPISAISATTHLILKTKHHQAEQNDFDSLVLLDADLAIFGSPPHQYQQYVWAIRQEYSWIPEQQYRVGRRQVLEKFLQRQKIYYTPQMVAVAEAIARQNLKAEIRSLI